MNLNLRIIDYIRHTNILKHYNWLCCFDGSSRDLAILQSKRLRDLLLFLKEHNSYYSPLLDKISIQEIRTDPVSVLKFLPVMSKSTINANRDRIITKRLSRHAQTKRTGGSTGEPFRYLVDGETTSLTWGYTMYCWRKYADYSPRDHLLTIAGNSMRSFQGNMKELIYHSLLRNYLIPAAKISRDMSFKEGTLEKIKLIYCYPSLLHKLIILNPDIPRLLKNLKAVFTTSEQLLPQTRETIQDALGVEVFDMYGANDGGLISCEDNSHSYYEYHPLNCYVEEYLNSDGFTELILTSLNSWTLPIVRYRVGDLAEVEQSSDKCRDHTFPRIFNLKGRTRDTIQLPSGRIIHGSSFNAILYCFPVVEQYQIVQRVNNSIEMKVKLRSDVNAVPKELKSRVNHLLNREVNLTFTIVNSFPVTDRKFKLIESHVN